MSDKVTVRVEKSCRVWQSGDRAGFTEEQLKRLEKQGMKYTRLDTSTESKSKSDPEVRQDLREQARLDKAKDALEADDYMEMKSALADLSDEPAKGTKDEIRDRLEAIVNGSR
jgi:hypothetical protein